MSARIFVPCSLFRRGAEPEPTKNQEPRTKNQTSLHADIQQRAMINDLNLAIANALAQTRNNGNGVSTLGQGADGR